MRVAARDVKSGRVGSANRWITVPNLSSRELTLSSLILSEQERENQKNTPGASIAAGLPELSVSVDRRFARSSRLRYIVFIYNAARGKTGTDQPDITLQTQILRGKDVVITSPARPISTEGKDKTRHDCLTRRKSP